MSDELSGKGSDDTVPDVSGDGRVPRPPKLPVLAPGTTIGRYQLEDLLGLGGMGFVYGARDPELDRRVAIKLLRPELSSGSSGGRTLIAEAKAMAQLSHPNVCTIFEAGTVADRVYLAMEYVDGDTVREWLQRKRRSWREVCSVLADAARGLHAAHRAGIIHRDFKLDNVMIDREGRVRVMDFGLAGPSGQKMPQVEIAGDFATLERHLTTTLGSIAGTPAYIAPEQLAMSAADARSDQFAFSVTLYEALYGSRPYPGKTIGELMAGYTAKRAVDPPPGIPRRLRQLLVRGLSIEPDDRFPDMNAIIAELDRIQRGKRAVVGLLALAGVAMAVVAAAGYMFLAGRSAEAPCTASDTALADVWNETRRVEVEQAFAATGLPYASEQWQRTAALLDRYTARYRTMHRDACEATRVRAEQSDEMLDRRMFCLSGRRDELSALVGVLASADRETVLNATEAAHALGDIEQCARREALLATAPLPTGEGARKKISRVRARLAQIKAQADAGKYRAALARAEDVIDEARAARYPLVLGEALLLLGGLRAKAGELEGGERALIEAAAAADQGRDDLLRGRAFALLSFHTGWDRRDVVAGARWLALAEATLRRAGGDPRIEADLDSNRAYLTFIKGDIEATMRLHTRANELKRKVYGEEHPVFIDGLVRLAAAQSLAGQSDDALATLQEALEGAKRVLGAKHTVVADALGNIGMVYAKRGDNELAASHLRQSIEVWEYVYGQVHPELAIVVANLGYVAMSDGDFDAAIAQFRRALAIEESVYGRDHVHVAATLGHLGNALISNGDPAGAVSPLERAVAIFGDAVTGDALQTKLALARAVWGSGDERRGRRIAREARSDASRAASTDAAVRDAIRDLESWLDEI